MKSRTARLRGCVIAAAVIAVCSLCSNNQGKAGSEAASDAVVSALGRVPAVLREIGSDGGSFFYEEDCFCAHRVLVLDKTSRSLSVYSWCAYARTPRGAPDFGVFACKETRGEQLLFEGEPGGSEPKTFCLTRTTVGGDTVYVAGPCDGTGDGRFVDAVHAAGYAKRTYDCSEVEG